MTIMGDNRRLASGSECEIDQYSIFSAVSIFEDLADLYELTLEYPQHIYICYSENIQHQPGRPMHSGTEVH